MHSTFSELGPDGSKPSLGLVQRLRRLASSEPAISTVLQTRKGKVCIQAFAMGFEFATATNESGWFKKPLNEGDNSVRGPVG